MIDLQNRESVKDGFVQEVSKFQISTSAEIRVLVAEKDHYASIVLGLYQRAADGEFKPTEKHLEIPSALFPELKRTVDALGAILMARQLSGDFEYPEEEEPKEEKRIQFAHPSEQEFARVLDFYQIKWQYEPRTFAVRWDSDGNVIESFTPDFYLPDYDLYIELTTLKQELVTKKNRKVRHLKQLYPEINIKVMYAKDYKRLLEKFAGRAEPESKQAGNEDEEVKLR